MTHPPTAAARRRGLKVSLAAAAGITLTVGMTFTALSTASAATPASSVNPYSPAYQHPYRHGVIPTIGQLAKMRSYAAAHPNATTATGPETLSYGGGIDG
ncbi:MAG TPA: hypothetical protein VFB40_17365, partial [Actinocrinis sp.]